MTSVERSASQRRIARTGIGRRRWGLLAIAAIVSACASSGQHVASAAGGAAACSAGVVAGGTVAAGHRVLVGADCRIEVLGADDVVLAELDLRPTGREAVRRIVPASSVLFVLRANPGRLEAYRLPTLQPMALVGGPSLRAPEDLAIRVGADGTFVGYVLDNPTPFAYHDSDLAAPQPEVLRVSLHPHESDRRTAMMARSVNSFAAPAASSARTLESLALLPHEVRVVVREARRRYAEFFTDDGVLLERVLVADGAVLSNPN